MAFTNQSNIEAFLQITITDPTQVASVNRAIEEADNAIRTYCKQIITEVSDDTITVDIQRDTTKLFLPEVPVQSVTSVTEDGEALTVDDDYKLGSHGILHRIGRCFSKGIQNVTIVYTHGYAEGNIPQIIVDVATRAASRAFQAGLRSSETGGVIGITAKKLGDFSVNYQSDASGGVSEGILGASSANFLLKSEQRMLDEYRIKGV